MHVSNQIQANHHDLAEISSGSISQLCRHGGLFFGNVNDIYSQTTNFHENNFQLLRHSACLFKDQYIGWRSRNLLSLLICFGSNSPYHNLQANFIHILKEYYQVSNHYKYTLSCGLFRGYLTITSLNKKRFHVIFGINGSTSNN